MIENRALAINSTIVFKVACGRPIHK